MLSWLKAKPRRILGTLSTAPALGAVWLKAKPSRILGAVCVIGTLIPSLLYFTYPGYHVLEEASQDRLATSRWSRRSPAHPSLVFLGIDKNSKELDAVWPEELEQSPTLRLMKKGFPWNRKVYADVLDRLVAAGAKTVVFDMRLADRRDGDPEFREAIQRHPGKVILGSNLIRVFDQLGLRPTHELPSPDLIPPSDVENGSVGYVSVFPLVGNVVRHIQYRVRLGEIAGYGQLTGSAHDPELFALSSRALQSYGAPEKVPATRNLVRIRFAEDVTPRSLYEMFVEDLWTSPPYNRGAMFKDKIVLIGEIGNMAEDRLNTPFGTVLGATIQLSAINAALQNDFLKDLPIWGKLSLIALGGTVAWLLGALIKRPVLRLVSIAGAVIAYFAGAVLLFNSSGLYLLVLSPLLALTTSSVGWIAVEQILERRDKARIRRTLERYVSRDVVKEILDNPSTFLNSLRGLRRNITVLFSDVRNFTSMTEGSQDEHRLVSQLNEYFQEMVRIVFEHQGRLDKFIGDAVMADWGTIAPKSERDEATHAVAAALEMRHALARLNADWSKRDLPTLSFGIGINHGSAIVGNLGCEEKMEVTVIGDAVNTGSRLEGVTKTYRVDICIGESAAEMVRDSFILRSLDLIILKGKSKPVKVFTVIDRRNGTAVEPVWLPTHEEAMRLYRAGKFEDAERCWREVLAQFPGDTISETFIERCSHLQEEPPAEPWTGVYKMKTK
jgi:adenylate cyclase